LIVGWVHICAAEAAVQLHWQDNSNNESSFEIERSLEGGEFSLIASVSANTTEFEDESAIRARSYEYRVRARNAYGYSDYSNVAATILENEAPVIGEVDSFQVLRGEHLSVSVPLSDAESENAELVVEAFSSNSEVLALEDLRLELKGNSLNVDIGTGRGAGQTIVTLFADDGAATSQRSFHLEVLMNRGPTVSSVSRLQLSDAELVGPVSVTLFDEETDPSLLQVTGDSLDEDLVSSGSVRVEGTGALREVYFRTIEGSSGDGVVRLRVSDGVNETSAAVPFTVRGNKAPEVEALPHELAISSGGHVSDIAFRVSDAETRAEDLLVSVSSSHHGIVSASGLVLGGSGSSRTLGIRTNEGHFGASTVTVEVSDGLRSAEHTIVLNVERPEEVVEILNFGVADGLAILEVEDRPSAEFMLWKTSGLSGAWLPVGELEVARGTGSIFLMDLEPVSRAVCYRVVATQ